MNYITTNIRLPEDDYLSLKEEAFRKRKSLSAVIREKLSTKKPSEDYTQKIINLKTDWFTEKNYEDYRKMRSEIEERSKRYNW
ncbi:MAG: hypothetical protein HYU80_01230 [Candidatus Blackburnbacteria bacterium]|nr:hypothetical protein [Candidatus Blackburnbacteria bacterium]